MISCANESFPHKCIHLNFIRYFHLNFIKVKKYKTLDFKFYAFFALTSQSTTKEN
jgi:hypothetical protein